jgi:small GTP-binding protein
MAWSPDGQTLAVGSNDQTLRLWSLASGTLEKSLHLRRGPTGLVWIDHQVIALSSGSDIELWDLEMQKQVGRLRGHKELIYDLAWSVDQRLLASASADETVRIWSYESQTLVGTLSGHGEVQSVCWAGEQLASGTPDGTIRLWAGPFDAPTCVWAVSSAALDYIMSLSWSPISQLLASCHTAPELRIWDISGHLLQVLEGHTGPSNCVAFSPDGKLLASTSWDGTARLWRCDTWDTFAILEARRYEHSNWTKIAFHPHLPVLATLDEKDTVVRLWDIGLENAKEAASSLHHVTGKVVLVGNSGVGKTGLGWRLAHDEFKEHSSTHGQQFWALDTLSTRRDDGTECEAVLWDLAGQPDYRLIHGLFLDDAELALVLFDAADQEQPLGGVEFWLKTLAFHRERPCPVILVGARGDRGTPGMTEAELSSYCAERAIAGGYVKTSAKTRVGIDELIVRMKDQIPWRDIPATVTTVTFRRIKDYVLGQKESDAKRLLVDPAALRTELQSLDPEWRFDDREMMTAVGHVAKHGYVRILRTASGSEMILLRPELLNNLAASFVLEARRNPKGLGSLDEDQVRRGGYDFPELTSLEPTEREVILGATLRLFVERNLCFRETHGKTTFLIFPELINRKRPALGIDEELVEDMSYTVQGAVENVYAALVVLLGYTSLFIRTDQWQNQAQYELGQGEICGFRQIAERGGELELVLYYGARVAQPGRLLFQGLFERFLSARQVAITRYPPQTCPKCNYRQERAEVVRRTLEGRGFLFCSNCGQRIGLAKAGEAIVPAPERSEAVMREQATAVARTGFEAALVQLRSFIVAQSDPVPTPICFLSYAWGAPAQEVWVERQLATDLRNAGVDVVLDRWENAAIGSNIARFISRIAASETVVVIGSPLYREKYENKRPDMGYVVAAEVDLIQQRLLGTEAAKDSVLPVLIAGDETSSLPPLLRGRVWGDFRQEETYFATLFDLILTLFRIPFNHQAVTDLRVSLQPGKYGKIADGNRSRQRA